VQIAALFITVVVVGITAPQPTELIMEHRQNTRSVITTTLTARPYTAKRAKCYGGNSVCPSVRPFVTLMDRASTAEIGIDFLIFLKTLLPTLAMVVPPSIYSGKIPMGSPKRVC